MLLEINNLEFSYLPDQKLFQDFNFSMEEGQVIALAGESGCGKSTLLSLIYGLHDWRKGEIIFNGKKLKGPKGNLVPGEADMKLVAQQYDLMPYATVFDNVGKFISNINLKAKNEKVTELLEAVGMEDFAKVLPKNLSGGQQQRVAIARALSVTPKLLLLDEPFSNLDTSRKFELRDKFFSLVKNLGLSVIISTHNLEEIIPWVDKVAILKNAEILQYDSPELIYQQPTNEYVAKLLGEVNVFEDSEKIRLNLDKNFYFPQQIKVADQGLEAEVQESRFAGSFFWNKVKLDDKVLIIHTLEKLEGKILLSFCG
ncbi:ABC-type Fe3+/spermidine/putrescine transport systems, ATPase components [Soonwooa buanensis]|uniref:ABC-type Fe3+/spermidine/putrescine transport systems, ATPase components n=1 Tax=Soonwooa buanensis TaxID=619805 RepID=A0A1T5DSG2_9FLAO|nr:ABC transporter ATP-binding protein [Soonwooa buanensis]SKB74510.1 ABC-type Fe3+/spermidine/putrescine transport systems, ATPase components [Soonwooa buanensis]